MAKGEDEASVAAGCLLTILAIPVAMVMRGWALTKLWTWFVTHHFGVENPGLIGCLGLALILAFVVKHTSKPGNDESVLEKGLDAFFNAVLIPLCVVGIGYVLVLIRGQ